MLSGSNHLGFLAALLLAVVYAGCSAQSFGPSSPAPLAAVASTPDPTRPPVELPPETGTPPVRSSPAPTASPPPAKPGPVPDSQTWSAASPDGKWVASGQRLGVADPCGYQTSLKVAEVKGTVEWTAWEDQQPCALGTTNPQPLLWSADGRFLYFTNEPMPDGCAQFVNGSDLQRLDLQTGEVSQLASGVGLALALSPDETQMAYVAYYGRGLVIRDLASGQEREMKLPEGAQAGSLVWSPDATVLVLTLDPLGCSDTYSIVRVQVPVLLSTTLIESDPRKFVTTGWLDGSTVVLVDKDGRHWWLDAVSGNLSPAS